jgi:hypothetical protein
MSAALSMVSVALTQAANSVELVVKAIATSQVLAAAVVTFSPA